MEITLTNYRKKALVQKLIASGIKNKNILNAIYNVKRELFVNNEFKRFAYENNALPIDCNQTISQPYTVAFMTELLQVKPGDKVLEIGTGSGYQCALLEELGADVYSIERIEELYLKSKSNLEKLNYNIHLKCDDGTKGWKEHSPFDGIIVTAGSPKIPKPLIEQLNLNGRLVIPVGSQASQEVWQIIKTSKNGGQFELVTNKFKDFKFVPLIGSEGW
jgi:protein-L-isoaspartate(D-aspartate) O-methyltransferase